MADQTIDRVQLELKATSQGATEVVKGLVTQLEALKSVLNSLDTSKLKTATQGSAKVGIDTSGMQNAEKEVRTSINNIKRDLAGLKATKDLGLSGDGSSLISAQRKLAAIQGEANKLAETFKLAGDNRSGINIGTDMLQGYRTELADLQSVLNQTKGEIDAAVQDMNSKKVKINTGDSKSELDSLSDRIKKVAGNVLLLTGKSLLSGFKNLKSGISSIKSGISDMGSRLSKFANTGFMKILRYGFGIRSLYVLFRRLKEAIKDSFGSLQSSGAMFETTRANITALKNSLQTLKFQFGAAFEPIFNAIAPALQTLINYLVTVMNVISAFTAKLMGRSTYSKVSAVLTKTGSAAGGAAKNVKELNHQLQGFDELNNLTLDPGNSGGGGGGGGGGSDGAMYEPASVDDALGDFAQELAKKIEEGDWFGLGRTISDKLSEVLESIPWDSIYEKARNFGTGLAQFLNGLITPRLFGDVASTLASALNTAFYFLNSFGKEFDWVNFGNSIAEAINDFFETADFAEWGDTVHTYIAGILDAGIELLKSTDFEAIGEKLADFLNGLQVADLASKLLDFGLTLGGAIAEALKGLWTNSDLNTKIGLAIVGLITAGNLTGLSTQLGSVIASYFVKNPLTLGKITLAVGTAVVTFEGAKWVFENIADDFDTELASYYENFTWSEFWETIQTPDGSGIDWEAIKKAWVDMCADYFEPLFEQIDYWIDELKNKINNLPVVKMFNDMKSKIVAAWNGFGTQDNGVPHGYNGAPSDVAQRLDYQNSVKFWNQQGSNIIDGIVEGVKISLATNPFTAPMVLLYEYAKKAFSFAFDSDSPAKKMYPLGENILTGIVKGFKDAIKKYVPDALLELYEYFNGGGTTTEKQGYTAPGNFKNGSDKTHSKTGQKVTINTQYTGDIKGKNGLKDALTTWVSLMDTITDKDSQYQTSMLGAFQSVDEVRQGAENFRNLDRDFRSKNATYTTTMGGEITSRDQIEKARIEYEKLYNAWNSKDSKLNVNTGGQISNIGELEAWKNKFKTLFDTWNSKSATMSANVGGQMSNINNTDTWVSKIKNLLQNWVGKTANFNAGFNKSQGEIQGYADQMQRLFNSWTGRNATFDITANVSGADINRVADMLVEQINNRLQKSRSYKLVGAATGGIYANGGWHNIPQFAGGTSDALSHGSLFVAGERGSEIVGNINGRTEVLNRSQIAATIKAATVSGMRLFRGSQMVRPPEFANQYSGANAYGYDVKSQMSANNEAIMEQNRLLVEQNNLLRQIADKDLTVSTKDVFDATKKEANIYYERTGNSPFLY